MSDAATVNNALETNDGKRYSVESCVIKYEGEIEGAKGSRTVYFDRWGSRKVVKQTREGMQPAKTLTILDQNWFTNVDLMGKTGTRMESRYISRGEGMDGLSKVGKMVGVDIVAGKQCEKWRLSDDVTMWVWKHITLKTQVRRNGKIIGLETAYEVNDNVSIPEERFQIPADVTVTDITEPREVLKALGYTE